MKKPVLFFSDTPPADKKAIHIWMGKSSLPHDILIKHLAQKYLGDTPPSVSKSVNGKPYLLNSDLYFNLSDSEGSVAIAFHWNAPVGIDIETIRPLENMEELITDYFSKNEQSYIREKNTTLRFWEIWNKKEACFKALGTGLQDNMAEWDCVGKNWVRVNGIWVRSIAIKNNLSAAVAIHE